MEEKLGGRISPSLLELKQLEYLDLSMNNFSADIPEFLGSLQNLQYLNLSGAFISNKVPPQLGNLMKLRVLDFSGQFSSFYSGVNSFKTITEAHFANLISLEVLVASSNSLTMNVSSTWIPKFQLKRLDLASWTIGPKFPSWLLTQNSLTVLSLSNTGISDEIPYWFWNISSRLEQLDLSRNQIKGELPRILTFQTTFTQISLASNLLSGSLPRLSSQFIVLDFSNNSFSGNISALLCDTNNERNYLQDVETNYLQGVDLSDNLLSGEIPECFIYVSYLTKLNLTNNKFSGHLPDSLGELNDMVIFGVRNNKLSGELPSSLQNWRKVISIDLGMNKFSGSIPAWIGQNLPNLQFLSLSSNKFHGKIPRELCDLASLLQLDIASNNLSGSMPRCFNNIPAMSGQTSRAFEFHQTTRSIPFKLNDTVSYFNSLRHPNIYFISLDLSDNNLSGEIPPELTKLLGLLFLNLSNNHFSGNIPRDIGAMYVLEALDLSGNQLTGLIPRSLSILSSLYYLDISYNCLSANISTDRVFQNSDELAFINNDGLYGPPLQALCLASETSTTQDGEQNDISKQFYVAIVLGFVVGLTSFCAVLVYASSWRIAYFRLIEGMNERLLHISSKERNKEQKFYKRRYYG